MYLEYDSFISSLIWQECSSLFSKEIFDSISQEIKRKLWSGPLAVTEYPDNSSLCSIGKDKIYASSLSFKVCQYLKQSGVGFELEPYELAGRVVDDSKSLGEKVFSLSVGGQGFLNGTPSAELCKGFLSAVLESEGRVLFSPKSLFFAAGSSAKGAERVYEDKSLEVSVDCLITNLRTKVRGSKDHFSPEARFMHYMEEAPYRDREDCIMLLALLYDRELVLSSFLENYGSNENIPWLYRRFIADSSNLSKAIEPAEFRLSVEEVIEKEMVQGLNGRVESFCSALLPQFFRFRLELSRAFVGYPAKTIEIMRALVDEFYSFYNSPDVRALRGFSVVDLGFVYYINQALRFSVQKLYQLPEFTCESGEFVLKQSIGDC